MSTFSWNFTNDPFSDGGKALFSELERMVLAEIPILLLLSGGSSIQSAERALFPLLQKYPEHCSALLTISVLDERFSSKLEISNSLQFLQKNIPVLPFIPENEESLEHFGSRYAHFFDSWRVTHSKGRVLATLGMGPDGHIAGISPFPQDSNRFTQLFVNNVASAVGYEGNLEPSQRITLTLAGLEKIDAFYACISGEAKRAALLAFQKKSTPEFLHPVQLLHQLSAPVLFFTDLVE